MELKMFSGNYKDWRKCWTTFVHSTTLDKKTKFKILKPRLDDEIADCIAYLGENLERVMIRH